jgi:hypothetical protein
MVMLLFAIGLFGVAGAIWVATEWNERAGRWFAILCTVVTLQSAIFWLNDPMLLGLLLLPVAFAVVLFEVAHEWLLAGADPFPMPANLRGPELRDVIRNEMAAWNDGKETWEQMVAHAQPAIQEVLDLPLP